VSPAARCSRDDPSDRGPGGPVLRSVAVTQEDESVNPALAVGQLIVSVALVLSVLLQARGAGLSGAFGGDSAVYRSRRGIERRLWQFTIVLLVLFVLFSMASYLLDTTTA
jgi:preprotein translocase subunit SecG